MASAQKYCLVHFVRPVETGTEFHMTEWPLHITLAGVFAHNDPEIDIAAKLARMLAKQPAIVAHAIKEAPAGLTPVVLFKKRHDILRLHHRIADFLEAHKVAFRTPEFMHHEYLPHCTIQNGAEPPADRKLRINTVALVDMQPDGDWRRRKVLATFGLRKRRSFVLQVQTIARAIAESLRRRATARQYT
jgi:hypothetical protein